MKIKFNSKAERYSAHPLAGVTIGSLKSFIVTFSRSDSTLLSATVWTLLLLKTVGFATIRGLFSMLFCLSFFAL